MTQITTIKLLLSLAAGTFMASCNATLWTKMTNRLCKRGGAFINLHQAQAACLKPGSTCYGVYVDRCDVAGKSYLCTSRPFSTYGSGGCVYEATGIPSIVFRPSNTTALKNGVSKFLNLSTNAKCEERTTPIPTTTATPTTPNPTTPKLFAPNTKEELKMAITAYTEISPDDPADIWGRIGNWDVSRITDMSGIFFDIPSFNEDISRWDVSRVTNMSRMFDNALSFNRDISKWDVSKVTDMQFMFRTAVTFNGDLSKWDVSSVENMDSMFWNAKAFNSDLSDWDVSQVTSMERMFSSAFSFNCYHRDLSKWNVGNVKNMDCMFADASEFNNEIGKWDVSKVTSMVGMFRGAASFEGDISDWDVSNVENMVGMFWDAYKFDGDISKWDVAKVKDFRHFVNPEKTTTQKQYPPKPLWGG